MLCPSSALASDFAQLCPRRGEVDFGAERRPAMSLGSPGACPQVEAFGVEAPEVLIVEHEPYAGLPVDPERRRRR